MSCSSNIVFKDYTPNQVMLLPPCLEELIAENHPVRVVNDVIDRINIDPLLSCYKPGGTSVYHPKMLLKVLVYGYLSNIYSSRKMEAALQENIHFMWLSAMSRPDHNTIARFRSERLKDHLKAIFGQIVALLVDEGLVSIKTIYTDGTKIEANANKYTFVWGKSIKNSKDRIAKQLDELWTYTQKVAEQELKDEPTPDFEQVDAEKVTKTIQKIDQALDGKKVDKKVRQKLAYAKKNWPDKMAAYEQKEAVLGNRNSYSKTDKDATFMRMKDDHLGNAQLKAAYNWQISSSDQFIVNYTIHQNPTDTLTLKPHLDQFEKLYGKQAENLCADAGYGSEENYEYICEKQIGNYVKYNYFHKEQTKKYKEDPFRVDNLYYNPDQDKVYCPMGQPMDNIGPHRRLTTNGFEQTYTRYQARNCSSCPLRGQCHKAKGNRIIEINHNLGAHKQTVKQNLLSDKGVAYRKQRPADVEAVFGNIKQNKGFRRFMLKGIKKVEIEAGLLAIAHNLNKKAA
ncbi:IS1182 family transposase [Fulvivirgaceae bacterium BMA10]|uniref:IS1182 family transposase n=2 Tax=Splendidivirga corallicola TaxID=3051826 RepID=A0ABT8L295_9BACT|nr:IS1182 family transposase [Fulvivirgaceae bacterium BMA10]